jgi:DNA replication and repair protein RecF
LYKRVILQRNALLRQVRDHRQTRQALEYWDGALCDHGAQIVAARAAAVGALAQAASLRHRELSGGTEQLTVTYRPAMPEQPALEELVQGGPPAARIWLQRGLEALREREIQAGASLVGPHRDDLSFAINGMDANAYGSRGQQRTVTLALKLAELAYMQAVTAEQPILLLDDATSELDERRRAAIFTAAAGVEQAFLTTADEHVFADQTAVAQRWSVQAGALRLLR